MSNYTCKLVERVGSSPGSSDEAIHNAIERASGILCNIGRLEVAETCGHLQYGEVAHFQAKLKVGIRLGNWTFVFQLFPGRISNFPCS